MACMVSFVPDSATTFALDDAMQARRARTKMRLYVVCQCVGWGLLFCIQAGASLLFVSSRTEGESGLSMAQVSLTIQIMLIGLLLTHVSRRFIESRGWKRLGWLALLPRVFALALVVSVVWNLICFILRLGLLDLSLPQQYPLSLVLVSNVINSGLLLVGWYCAYFFYQLFERFRHSEIERLRLANLVNESELRALKSQVNPHFIFNSLNSVRALIDEDPVRARHAVTQLANMLRYSLQSGQLETVPFDDELAVVNDYLALEQVRHEERLRLRLDIAPETRALPVPVMVLQTLVENAIKYGIAKRPGGGEISIRTWLKDDTLHLCVTNPGQLTSASNSALHQESTGLGLDNAAARLQLIFGKRATLQLSQSAPDVVMAEVAVPLREADLEAPDLPRANPSMRPSLIQP